MASFDDDSDEEETFVTLGTPLEVPDEDEPVKKPVQLDDMQATDSQGRPRFHGAFTGGFSAGYFNTVGSKEGFVPKTFVSSRAKRAEGSEGGQRPEDYMDEEDVGEHGIAPRKFVTGGMFSSEERRKRRMDEAKLATSDSILGGDNSLLSVIVPERYDRVTIGVKLLRKMGWKEGQGIGPRISRKQKRLQGKKLYGCAGPSDSDDEDLDDKSVLSDVTFAPLDSAHVLLGVKENTHGLGYSGLDPRKALPSTHVNLFELPPVRKGATSRKGIRGQAFGVGALEDEDEDIYTRDDMSNYDLAIGDEGDNNFGWTAPKHRGKEQQTPVGYVGKMLEGFSLSSKKLVQSKEFPPPSLPRDYRPVHTFPKPVSAIPSSVGQPTGGVDYRKFLRPDIDETPLLGPTSTCMTLDPVSGQHTGSSGPRAGDRKERHDALSRSVALEEQPFVGSVFDLIPKADRARMTQAKQGLSPGVGADLNTLPSGDAMFKVPAPPPMPVSALLPKKSFVSAGSETLGPAVEETDTQKTITSPLSIEDGRQSAAPLFQGAVGFQPFSRDPAKQGRYERYLELIRQGHKDPYSAVGGGRGHTEWEVEREREEFSKAAKLYRPLATMMAARFTSGGTYEQGEQIEVKVEENAETSDAAKAAKMKMFGKLTREVHEWHPDNLVCKRFNVPNPYPGSTIVGLTTVKRDKYSVFNFLNFANPNEMAYDAKKTDNSKLNTERDCEKADEKSEDVAQKVDKELNKGKAMKSIFSHLMETESETQRKTKPISFSMKSKPSNKPKEFKSIFSHLENEAQSVISKTVTSETKPGEESKMETTSVNVDVVESQTISQIKEKSSEEDSPGMDLFRAIFRNTDSEASSSSEDEVEGQEGQGSAWGQQALGNNPQQTVGVKDDASHMVAMETGHSTPVGCLGSTSRLCPPNSMVEESDPYGPSLPLAAANDPVSGTSVQSLPGYTPRSPCSSDEGSDEYGPALPPAGPSDANGSGPLDIVDLTTPMPDMYVDLTRDTSRKHKHKDRHKHKKNKKDKHAKSKHKKKGKKKDKKKRSRRDPSSSDTSDSSGNEDVDTDRQILQRLKSLQSAQKISGASWL
ncbi:G patch domain-containing protein 1-like isoform X1 [Dreissena polymorpha]|uniref:G patch domain-containing protein 1-like isoform X1 n=1 Tax=Dreissena polymorpha TaxID=45954 RepID=UPI002263B1FC|nr:G patch domain-containing protein 1-like isoform X1 [Dreissena polymorpha]